MNTNEPFEVRAANDNGKLTWKPPAQTSGPMRSSANCNQERKFNEN